MARFSVNSLLFRLIVIFVAITLLVIFSMLNAIYTANAIQGQAAAINESGKLRMRSYRIANELSADYWDSLEHWKKTVALIKGFEQHLKSPRLLNVLPEGIESEQGKAYDRVKQQWYEQIKPLFDLYLEGIVPPSFAITEGAITNLRKQYLLYVDEFVSRIDRLVLLLEKDTEIKIHSLYRYQLITLVFSLVLIVIALFVTWRFLMKPMRSLLFAADQISRARFSYRTDYTGEDELGKLGQAFNYMSEELEVLYANLEQRVEEKTRTLERSNAVLQFLLTTARKLFKGSTPQEYFQEILLELEKVIALGKGATICLRDQSSSQAIILATTEPSDRFYKEFCLASTCEHCLLANQPPGPAECFSVQNNRVVIAPIKDASRQYGILVLRNDEGFPLKDWQKDLILSVAQQLAAAINKAQIESELHKIALHEERSIIARELHDSLAQSLTFMKIQISRLLAQTGDADEQVKKIQNELKEGLNEAYKELRQLLDTFRFKPESKEFISSLNQMISNIKQQGKLEIMLDNRVAFFDFTPNEEIHLLQIIREALSNVVQHANASKVNILLDYCEEHILVQIEDDGIGIAETLERPNHYGIISMRERTAELGGSMTFTNKDSGGLCIKLYFQPHNKMIPLVI